MAQKVSDSLQFHKKTGIMGGTFNPIHYGHLLMAERAMEEFALDEVCFIPTGLQWMKKGDPDLLPSDVRYEMTRMAIKDREGFSLSRIEIDRKGNTYTYETMQALRKQQPDTRFYYILGADTLAKMDQWVHPELVFDSTVILCAVRTGDFPALQKSASSTDNGSSGDKNSISAKEAMDLGRLQAIMDMLKDKYGADIRLLSMPRMDISSTDIRSRVKTDKSIRYLLPETVREYILDHRLYR